MAGKSLALGPPLWSPDTLSLSHGKPTVGSTRIVALLFVAELVKLHIGTIVALSFILAMALLISALASFLIEVRMSLNAIRIRPELLER